MVLQTLLSIVNLILKKSSAYYKQGYDFGLTFRDALTKKDLDETRQEKK